MTQLRRDANISGQPLQSKSGSAVKKTTFTKELPKTPTKRAGSSPKTPDSKKRKLTASSKNRKRKDSDGSDVIDLTSSDEDNNQNETTSDDDEDEDAQATPKASDRRKLPVRTRMPTAKSYAADDDTDSQDAGARSDSDGDDDFYPSTDKPNERARVGNGSPQKRSGVSARGHGIHEQSEENDEELGAAVEDDRRSATTHASWKTAKEDLDDEDDY